MGDLQLQKVGPREIEGFLVRKIRETSFWSARKYYAHLASAFETARRWGHITANPFRQVKKPKVAEIQPRYLSRAEFQKLVQVVQDTRFKDLILCATLTGMRSGELRALRWEDVHFERRIVLVQNRDGFTTKSKRNRVIPMNETLYHILWARHLAATSPMQYVFTRRGRPYSVEYISRTFKKHVRAAKLDDRLHFHSLRHMFASWLAVDGVSLYAIQKLLDHSSSIVTQMYAHLQLDQLHSTVNRIELPLN